MRKREMSKSKSICPLTDGNGRMGRYWQTVLLAAWRPQVAWVPVEEIIRDRQEAYYQAIANTDKTGDARMFIEFMLTALRDALMAVKKSVGKSVGKILELLSEFPEITRESLAAEVGLVEALRGYRGTGPNGGVEMVEWRQWRCRRETNRRRRPGMYADYDMATALSDGENVALEFKEARPKDSLKFVKTVVAFANGRGGRILFGVEDKT